ncbi:transposase [Texcoconibacillus texcoconensis]|uniref:Transposase n=1 Tax=Texcoconibacillus texcoconensis TaxID=1095777 RepID=A0A840QMW1_9BACI|nr:transposase [Texcoconibacillus texcoconensis]MBB5172670.1 transposase [Texcoconibacillus texcoconensis]
MGEHRQRYNEEFKKQTVRYVQEQKKTVSDMAEELKVPTSTLYEWIAKYREFDNEPIVYDERIQQLEQQLKKKERELKDREEELAIVKKAVHIFSRPKV